jgi:hypothetical protein
MKRRATISGFGMSWIIILAALALAIPASASTHQLPCRVRTEGPPTIVVHVTNATCGEVGRGHAYEGIYEGSLLWRLTNGGRGRVLPHQFSEPAIWWTGGSIEGGSVRKHTTRWQCTAYKNEVALGTSFLQQVQWIICTHRRQTVEVQVRFRPYANPNEPGPEPTG